MTCQLTAYIAYSGEVSIPDSIFGILNGELFASHLNGTVSRNGKLVELLSNLGFHQWRNVLCRIDSNVYYHYDPVDNEIISYFLPPAHNYTALDKGDFLITSIENGISYYSRFKSGISHFKLPTDQNKRLFLNSNFVITQNRSNGSYGSSV